MNGILFVVNELHVLQSSQFVIILQPALARATYPTGRIKLHFRATAFSVLLAELDYDTLKKLVSL